MIWAISIPPEVNQFVLGVVGGIVANLASGALIALANKWRQYKSTTSKPEKVIINIPPIEEGAQPEQRDLTDVMLNNCLDEYSRIIEIAPHGLVSIKECRRREWRNN